MIGVWWFIVPVGWACINTYAYFYLYLYACIYICIYIYVCIFIYVYIYIHDRSTQKSQNQSPTTNTLQTLILQGWVTSIPISRVVIVCHCLTHLCWIICLLLGSWVNVCCVDVENHQNRWWFSPKIKGVQHLLVATGQKTFIPKIIHYYKERVSPNSNNGWLWIRGLACIKVRRERARNVERERGIEVPKKVDTGLIGCKTYNVGHPSKRLV